jgi:hypothetical protein
MSGDELRRRHALCAPISTTSLYEQGGDSASTARVLTLQESNAVYSTLPDGASSAEGPSEPEHAAPHVVVQLRKRGGRVQLFVDGHVSRGAGEDAASITTHTLHHHSGLHHDADTQSRVFSPIAIACAIEDGQRPIAKVSVGVWQTFSGLAPSPVSSTLLSDATLLPHRVSDTRCKAVVVPYPLLYHPHPVVSIYDDAATRKMWSNERFRLLSPFFKGLAKEVSSGLLAYTSALGFAGVVLAASQSAGYWGTAVGAAVFNNFIDVPTESMQKRVLDTLGNFTLMTLLSRPIEPPKLKSFALRELAAMLEAIAESGAIKEAEHGFVWDKETSLLVYWMTSDKSATGNVGQFISSDLLAQNGEGVQLHISVDVDDSLDCTGSVHRHEIRCGREDWYYLSNAALGTLGDLARIRTAIGSLLNQVGDLRELSVADNLLYKKLFRPYVQLKNIFSNIRKNPKGALYGQLRKLLLASDNIESEFEGFLRTDLENFRNALMKLNACFCVPKGDGFVLRANIESALLSKARPNSGAWRRKLPQRIGSSNIRYTFSSVTGSIPTQHIDTVDISGTSREFTKCHDASQALSAAMRSAHTCLRRAVPRWEARSATRMALNCECVSINDDNETKFVEPFNGANICCSTLAISTPVDILFSAAVSRFTEESLRRIRFVVKRAQQKCDKSLLESLGLQHTSEDLLVCQVFGDLWACELVTLHRTKDEGATQMQCLEEASRRAALRLRAAGTVLREMLAPLPTVDADDADQETVPDVEDVSIRATLAGRDAGKVLQKLLFVRDTFEVRAVMAATIRNVAVAAVRVASAFEARTPARLPHEPLESLFGGRADCVAAFMRAAALMPSDLVARRAMVAAYASSHLVTVAEQEELSALLDQSPVPWADAPTVPSAEDLIDRMRHRMASLRIDYDVLGVVDEMDKVRIDDLAQTLTVSSTRAVSFYAPFGFGDARPAPTLPPCSVPMFGTVPVLGDALKRAFLSMSSPSVSDGACNASSRFRVHLKPALRCAFSLQGEADGKNPHEQASVHPNVLQVQQTRDGSSTAFEVHFTASRSRSDKCKQSATEATNGGESLSMLAQSHVCSVSTLEMAHEVSSIAWNAERMVQSVIAALASAQTTPGTDFAICVTLELPRLGEYLESWYHKGPTIAVDVATKEVAEAQTAVREAKNWATKIEEEVAENVQNAQENAGAASDNKSPNQIAVEIAVRVAQQRVQEAMAAGQQRKADAELELEHAKTLLRSAEGRLLEAERAAERCKRVLLGALGIAIAVLDALVSPFPVTLANTISDWKVADDFGEACRMAAGAFGKCRAVRLSEACLVISQTL